MWPNQSFRSNSVVKLGQERASSAAEPPSGFIGPGAAGLGFLGIGLSCAIVGKGLMLLGGGTAVIDRLLSIHSLTLVLLVWGPSLSWVSLERERRSRETHQALITHLGTLLFIVGGVTMIVFSCLMPECLGYRYYVGYFGAKPWVTIGVAIGHSLVSTALAMNGWFWLRNARCSRVHGLVEPLAETHSVVGFVHLVLLPFAWFLPLVMVLGRLGIVDLLEPERGGDPTLLASLFWFHVQPTLLLAILPWFGLLSESFRRRNGFVEGNACMLLTTKELVAIATLSFFAWGTRIEVGLGSVLRNALAVPCLFAFVLIGRGLYCATVVLLQERKSLGAHSGSWFLGCLGMWLVLLGFVSLVLAATGALLQDSPLEVAKQHWLGAIAVSAVCGVLHKLGPPASQSICAGASAAAFIGLSLLSLSAFDGRLGDARVSPVLNALALAGALLLAVALLLPAARCWAERRRFDVPPSEVSPLEVEELRETA